MELLFPCRGICNIWKARSTKLRLFRLMKELTRIQKWLRVAD